MKTATVVLALLLSAAPAYAADVAVEVRDAAGRPVSDAVVLVRPQRAEAGPIRFPWPLVMTQKDVAFTPRVLIVPVGSTVAFPNKDKVRHHVYSFSPTKKFELKLYGRQEERQVTFDKPGPVPLGCNIHDAMVGYIYVSDTPYAAKTEADGRVVLRGVPAGGAALTVWHASARGKSQPRPLAVPAAGTRQTVTLDLRPARG